MEGKLHLPKAEQQICVRSKNHCWHSDPDWFNSCSAQHPWRVQPVIRTCIFLEVRRWYQSPSPIRSAALPVWSPLVSICKPLPRGGYADRQICFWKSITFLRQKLQPKCHCSQTATVEIHRAAQLDIAKLSGSAQPGMGDCKTHVKGFKLVAFYK